MRRPGEAAPPLLKRASRGDEPLVVTDLASPSSTTAQDLLDLPLQQLRARRAALAEQASRAARWRRLVQARLDLLVDAAAPVEELGGAVPPLRPLVEASAAGDPVEQLVCAAQAGRDLRAWSAALESELGRTTDELVERYRLEPARCLAVVPLR